MGFIGNADGGGLRFSGSRRASLCVSIEGILLNVDDVSK